MPPRSSIANLPSFFDHYHPSLPFLDPSKSPDDYYNSGTHLFWAIIGVASRRYDEDFFLFAVLSEWLPKLIWSSIADPPYHISLVQSIILIATWPFPVESTYNSTLITLSSIAISTAMQLGLHRPMNATDFSRELTQMKLFDLEGLSKLEFNANSFCRDQGRG